MELEINAQAAWEKSNKIQKTNDAIITEKAELVIKDDITPLINEAIENGQVSTFYRAVIDDMSVVNKACKILAEDGHFTVHRKDRDITISWSEGGTGEYHYVNSRGIRV